MSGVAFASPSVLLSQWITRPSPVLRSLGAHYRLYRPSKFHPMADTRMLEGIFAIDKPPNYTSAQLVNRLKVEFSRSDLFAPLVNANSVTAGVRHKKGNRVRNKQIKIGHGGTLDPNATGVLVIGVGAGTKSLQGFLTGSTKSYEATILFGAATDSYDTDGKVLKRASFAHVTREAVEKALEQFRGKGTQRPPIYSALKMNGKRLCDYAREGREIPREIERRNVDVSELEILEWLEGSDHNYEVQGGEADLDSKKVAQAVLHLQESKESDSLPANQGRPQSVVGEKRKRSIGDEDDDEDDGVIVTKKLMPELDEYDPSTLMSGGLQTSEQVTLEAGSSSSSDSRGPAVKLRMTVSSGFYVRSLAHDLGEAVNSLACMCALARTRQGEFKLGFNTIHFEDLEKGEGVWGPMIKQLIKDSSGPKPG